MAAFDENYSFFDRSQLPASEPASPSDTDPSLSEFLIFPFEQHRGVPWVEPQKNASAIHQHHEEQREDTSEILEGIAAMEQWEVNFAFIQQDDPTSEILEGIAAFEQWDPDCASRRQDEGAIVDHVEGDPLSVILEGIAAIEQWEAILASKQKEIITETEPREVAQAREIHEYSLPVEPQKAFRSPATEPREDPNVAGPSCEPRGRQEHQPHSTPAEPRRRHQPRSYHTHAEDKMFRILEAELNVSLVRDFNIAQQELKNFLVDEEVDIVRYFQDLKFRIEREQAQVAHKTRMLRYRDFAEMVATCDLMDRVLDEVKGICLDEDAGLPVPKVEVPPIDPKNCTTRERAEHYARAYKIDPNNYYPGEDFKVPRAMKVKLNDDDPDSLEANIEAMGNRIREIFRRSEEAEERLMEMD